jgi:chromatin structure-remodeling complex subunit RSC9
MAPPRTTDDLPSEVHNQELQEFLAQLRVFHENRGTTFDPDPKVGSKQINILELYRNVVGRGGYDKVSEEKLLWRKIAQEFGLGSSSSNLPALAFGLKSIYYRQLAAYEITYVHGKVPPPKEILEETTAKGAGLLTRTLENFRPSARRETLGPENSEASGDDGTPARDGIGSEETPGSGGRVTRGLRQAPPQRVLFQPGTQPARQTRHSTSHPAHTQQHQQQGHRGASTSYNPPYNIDNLSVSTNNFDNRPAMPLTLRPVITPGNNPIEFARREHALKLAAAVERGKIPATAPPRLVLPGCEFIIYFILRVTTDTGVAGFDGPNIYVRCLMALKSGIPAEQSYALHHLVKISMERGDKYRFESFPGLAEALIEKVLEVSSLFYKVKWEIAYLEDESLQSPFALNGVYGTKDILERIAGLSRLDVDDNLHPAEFRDTLLLVNEAALTLRNMILLEENAYYVSEMYPLRDLLSIVLNLPALDSVVELKHYALDIAEQLTKYMSFDVDDPLYISLLAQLHSADRGTILTSLRAISRISMNLEENNLLKGVPALVVEKIIDWTLLHDEELVGASLDFLYQYTAVVDNVDYMVTELQLEPLVNQLTRLLSYGAKIVEKEVPLGPEYKIPAPDTIAPLPQELQSELEKLDEPERSSQWLRCLFEEDRDESITQIAMWQAYQARFSPMAAQTGRALLPAAEFIKNVSTTFGDKVAAQVQSGPVQKFIIKGLRRRITPVNFKGEAFAKCLWKKYGNSTCGEFFMSPEQMYQHILRNHIGAIPMENGQFENTTGQYMCYWNACEHFHSSPASKLVPFATHIKTHLPRRKPSVAKDSPDYFGQSAPKKQRPSYIIFPPKQIFQYQVTMTDERGDAAGIPLSAVLVLRNLARNLSKTEAEEVALKEIGVSWVDRLFKPVERQLFEIMVHNRSLVSPNRSQKFASYV